MVSFALPGMRKWMRIHTRCWLNLLQGIDRASSERSISVRSFPSWCSLHVAIVWMDLSQLDRDDMAVKAFLNTVGFVIRTPASCFCFIHSAPCVSGLVYGDEQGVYTQQRFICCCCAFWALRMVSSSRAHRSYSGGRKS